MNTNKVWNLMQLPALGLICLVWLLSGQALAETTNSADSLHAKYAKLIPQLSNNQFQRELYLYSNETSHSLKGEIYAVLDYPFAVASKALNSPQNWCDILILHLNIKYCHADSNKPDTMLRVNLGRKTEQALGDTFRINFNYHQLTPKPDYFSIELDAKNGPLSTHNYHIKVGAVPLDNEKTFIHFTYGYDFGMTGRLAAQAYLATMASDKVGFTVTGKQTDGGKAYVKGVRGLVERNTMRYYLAIDAYLSALTLPANEQLSQRLQQWFKATEQYRRQLHEIDQEDYLAMKANEYRRQNVPQLKSDESAH